LIKCKAIYSNTNNKDLEKCFANLFTINREIPTPKYYQAESFNSEYEDKQEKENKRTLEIRRLKMDLIMLFKITHNLVALDFRSFFGLTNYTSTRGHNCKLVKPIMS